MNGLPLPFDFWISGREIDNGRSEAPNPSNGCMMPTRFRAVGAPRQRRRAQLGIDELQALGPQLIDGAAAQQRHVAADFVAINFERARRTRLTAGGDALYLHCLPADIGAEVSPAVMARHRVNVARQANKKLFVIMALLAVAKVTDLTRRLEGLTP